MRGVMALAASSTGNLDMIEGQVTDADIMAAVASVLPIASTVWVAISN